MFLVGGVERAFFGAVDVEDRDELAVWAVDRHDDFRLGAAVAGDVAGKGVDVGDDLGLAGSGGRPAYAFAEGDAHAAHGALVWSHDELALFYDIETGPKVVGQGFAQDAVDGGHLGDNVGFVPKDSGEALDGFLVSGVLAVAFIGLL